MAEFTAAAQVVATTEIRQERERPTGRQWIKYVGVATALGVGAIAFSLLSVRGRSSGDGTTVSESVHAATPKAIAVPTDGLCLFTPPGEVITWQGVPIPALVNEDDVEDVIGVYQKIDRGQRQLFVGAYDGLTWQQIWKIGPVETQGAALQLAVADRRLLVTGLRAAASLYNVSTGERTTTVALDGQARQACQAPDDEGKIWIAVANGRNMTIDVFSGATRLASRPAWCPELPRCLHVGPSTACHPGSGTTDEAGFTADLILSEGEVAVALGRGGALPDQPMAVGYATRNQSVRWRALVSSDRSVPQNSADLLATLDRGTLFTHFRKADGSMLVVAIDALTGERRWEVTVPCSRHGYQIKSLVASATRVYAQGLDSLVILDRTDGRLVGTVGRW